MRSSGRSRERMHYRVLPDSPVMEVISQARCRASKARQAACLFAEEYGATGYAIVAERCVGLKFDGEPPAGWHKGKGKDYARPQARTKLGRELAAKLSELPPGVTGLMFTSMLSSALGGNWVVDDDHLMSWTMFEIYGAVHILSVPVGCKEVPPACQELKMSEYWKIVEDHEALKESAQ